MEGELMELRVGSGNEPWNQRWVRKEMRIRGR